MGTMNLEYPILFPRKYGDASIDQIVNRVRAKSAIRENEPTAPAVSLISIISSEGRKMALRALESEEIVGESNIDSVLSKLRKTRSVLAFYRGFGGIMLKVIADSLVRGRLDGWNDEIFIEEFNNAARGIISPITKDEVVSGITESPRRSKEEETKIIVDELSKEEGKNFLGFFSEENKLPQVIKAFLGIQARPNKESLFSGANFYGKATLLGLSVYREAIKMLQS
ncbi:MAG: hypothetical protein Q8P26_04630 [Candidatus Levybacteria bacterium]|nr:hypothetical protein [Candidatus Levybacteria bacterium]